MNRDLSRSRAFVVGNGVFRGDSGISALPGAEASVQAFASLLRGELCGWPAESVSTLIDAATPSEFSIALHSAAQTAQDVLLVYYVGRSLRTRVGGLALAMRETLSAPALLPSTGLPYEQLIDLMNQCPAATKVLILDCGTSVPPHVAGQPGQVGQVPPIGLDGRALVGNYRGIGAGQLDVSAGVGAGAGVGPGVEVGQGAGGVLPFTSALVDAVQAGIPGQPGWLTTDQVFAAARGRLFAAGLPEPASVGAPTAPVFVFARNSAVGPGPGSEAQGPVYVPVGTAGGATSATMPMPAPAPAPVPSPAPGTGWHFPPGAVGAQPQPQFQTQPPAASKGVSRRNLLIGGAALVGVAAVGTAVVLATRSGGGGGGNKSVTTAQGVTLPDSATAHAFSASGYTLGLVNAGATIAAGFYVTDSSGSGAGGCEVLAWNVSDGSVAWHTGLPGESLNVFYQAGSVICTVSLASQQGDVIYAFNPATGAQQWKYSDGVSYLDASPGTGSTIYVGSNPTTGTTGTLVALDAASGSPVWRTAAIDGFVGTPGVSGTDVVVDVSTVSTTSECFLYSFDQATGNQNWVTDSMAGIDVEGFYQGSRIVAVSTVTGDSSSADDFTAVVYGIDPASGGALWQHPVSGTSVEVIPEFSGDSLLLLEQPGGTAASTLVCVDPASGDQKWSFTVAPETPVYAGGDFGVSKGVVYAFSYPPTDAQPTKLNAISLTDGGVHWTSSLVNSSPGDVVFANGLAYVPGSDYDSKGNGIGDCNLSIFDASSGAEARQPVPLPGCVNLDGALVVGKSLYIIGQSSRSTTSSTGFMLFRYAL